MVDEHLYKFNKYQTPITKELKKSLRREVYEDVIESITSIQFIKNLIAPEEIRGFAKDQIRQSSLEDGDSRKHYNDDRIVVDVTNPHILEGLDFFRERAIYFEEHGTYTHLTPNPNPKSEYAEFWKEELRRWKHGLVRPSDGEWIPGYLYFYWNYSPIWLVVKKNESDKKGERKRAFPRPWLGDYIFFHYIDQAQNNGKHVKNLKSRGVGVSFKCASMSPRNLYVYPGAGNVNFHLANEKGYLQGDKGLYGKVLECLDHIAENTPLPKLRLIDGKKEMVVQLGYQDEYGVRKGLLSSIHAISLKDNPEKARGTRGVFCHYEEDGIFDNLEKAWNVNRPGFEDGDVAVGLMMALGTGGVEGASFEGSEKLFYNPLAYNIYGIPNVFDKNTDGSTVCGHFWGAYLNRNGCYDSETGEPDVIQALIEIHEKRFDVKYNSRDPNAITQAKAEHPITPQEAVLRTEGTVFPVSDLKEHMESIAANRDRFLSEHYVGELVRNNEGIVTFKPSADKYPIRSYDVDSKDREGCLEIFEMPRKNANGEIPYGRYIAGCLPPGEKVLTDKGLKDIELVNYDDKLINKDGKLVDIIECKKFTVDEPLYEVKVGNTFRTTKFTGEHPLYVSDIKWRYTSANKAKRLNIPYKYKEFNPSFKEVKDVEIGQWIKVPNIYKSKNDFNIESLWDDSYVRVDRKINNPLLHEDFWWFIGLWLGDGYCVGKHNIVFSLNSREEEYIDKLLKIISTLFDRNVYIRDRNGCKEISFCNKQLNSFLNKHFGKYAKSKTIPEWGKRIDNNLKLNLIGGYLASDGCVTKNKSYYSAEFVSINLELLESFQDILFSVGLISGLSKLRDAKIDYIGDKKVVQQETYHLRLSNHDTIELAKLLVDIDSRKIKRIDSEIIKNFKDRRYSVDCEFDETKDYIYFKIKDIIKSDYKGDVYNFECDTNTFMCHHITTHNCDPIDSDTGNSLFSIIIMDLFTDRIVAEYTGRPRLAEEAYEIALRTLEFYNAQANYESNLKGLFSYFDKFNKLHLLTDVPQIVKDIQNLKHSNLFGNNAKGTRANKEINKWGRKLQADWMLHPVDDAIVDEDSEDDAERDNRLKLHTLRSLAYIDECIRWNSDGNFDRVSAAGMLFILREDRFKITESAKSNVSNTGSDLAEDNFFNRNYDFKRAMRVYDDEE